MIIDHFVAGFLGSFIVCCIAGRIWSEFKARRAPRLSITLIKSRAAGKSTLFTEPNDKTVLDLMIGHERALTDAEKENLRVIVLKARAHNEKNIREAEPGKAIELANRIYESERYFREKGVKLDE